MKDWLALVIQKFIAREDVAHALVTVHARKTEHRLAFESYFVEFVTKGESFI
jgi:hypothetical protein